MNWLDVFIVISNFSYIVPITGLLLYNRRIDFQLKFILLLYLTISFIPGILSEIIPFSAKISYMVINIYTLIAGIFVFGIFRLFFTEKKNKQLTWILGLMFLITSIYFAITENGFSHSNTIPYIILSLSVMFLVLYYFRSVFMKLEIIELTKHLPFWISSAMLIYFGSTIFFSLFEEILRGSDNWVFYYTFQIQLSATILFNILITIGLWRTRQTYC